MLTQILSPPNRIVLMATTAGADHVTEAQMSMVEKAANPIILGA